LIRGQELTIPTKCALVTGGSKRIGRSIVEDLASNGYAVAIHCNSSPDEASALADQIKATGGRAIVVQADLTDRAAVTDLIPHAISKLGPISLLVNNASVFEDDALGTLDHANWDAHFDVHLRAPVFLSEGFATQNDGHHEGLIVNIIDQRVLRLNPLFFSYTLSKSALWTATKTMAQALAPRIRVNAIGPGPTLKNARQKDADFAKQIKLLPLKHAPALAEFGRTIRYFDETPSITGQMIAIDGGQHLYWQAPDVVDIEE
jgi:NAD(P)-dependent dehydrogenase (short-subunit alcohol dehydrogenase family)